MVNTGNFFYIKTFFIFTLLTLNRCGVIESKTDTKNGNPNNTVVPQIDANHPLLEEINALRTSNQTCGSQNYPAVQPLVWDSVLEMAAKDHTLDMKSQGEISHTGSDGSNAGERVGIYGYEFSWLGENVAWGHSTYSAVLSNWMESPGHCANIMNPDFTHYGYFEDSTYHTQVFSQPR